MPYACFLATVWVLLLQQGHHKNYIVAGYVGDNEINCIAVLDISAIAYARYMPYNSGGVK